MRGGRVCETTFTLVDLAGAERPSKVAGSYTPSPEMMIWESESSGKAVQDSLEAQTLMINYELFLLGREVLTATEKHRRGRSYAPPRQATTPFIRFMGACLDGSCRTAMIVTLSQAPQNGWETWFSLQYGTDLSKLRVPLNTRTPRVVGKELKAARAAAAEAAKVLNAGPPPPTAPAFKYWAKKESAAHMAISRLAWLSRLEELSVSYEPTACARACRSCATSK